MSESQAAYFDRELDIDLIRQYMGEQAELSLSALWLLWQRLQTLRLDCSLAYRDSGEEEEVSEAAEEPYRRVALEMVRTCEVAITGLQTEGGVDTEDVEDLVLFGKCELLLLKAYACSMARSFPRRVIHAICR
ncbi:MAG: hypothetical protein LC808_14065 [Actinobacteria bacterium]|nr:hypothetical protein [Actinomycetota bacterium]